jgi:hypothetical protein
MIATPATIENKAKRACGIPKITPKVNKTGDEDGELRIALPNSTQQSIKTGNAINIRIRNQAVSQLSFFVIEMAPLRERKNNSDSDLLTIV